MQQAHDVAAAAAVARAARCDCDCYDDDGATWKPHAAEHDSWDCNCCPCNYRDFAAEPVVAAAVAIHECYSDSRDS